MILIKITSETENLKEYLFPFCDQYIFLNLSFSFKTESLTIYKIFDNIILGSGVLPFVWKKVLENTTRGDGDPEGFSSEEPKAPRKKIQYFSEGLPSTPSGIFQYFFSDKG